MINLEHAAHYPAKEVTQGHYFKSQADPNYHYILSLKTVTDKVNVIAKIYEMPTVQDQLINLVNIAIPTIELIEIVQVDIWPKYYFLQWPISAVQQYHQFDTNLAIAEAIKHTLKLGIEQGRINLR